MKTWMWISAGITALVLSGCGKSNSQNSILEDDKVVDSYIVVLKKEPVQAAATMAGVSRRVAVTSMVHALGEVHGLQVDRTFSVALQGGVYRMTGRQAKMIGADDAVAYVEKDQIISINATRSNSSWGPDRIDQNSLPLDQSYTYVDSGATVNAYVIDTGILTTHQEFAGRASSGIDLVDKDDDATDCNGHGTHVAGTIGSTSFGMAKNVKLVGIRVLNCQGSGKFSDVIAGIDWVTANHVKPAVANMSLGGPVSQAVDDAVTASVQAGVTFVLAAGNENTLACNSSPARVPSAITVGATTNLDARASFSNFGTCVDVFAPGEDIESTWIGSNSATDTISGTSMASPHVAGVAALYLSQHPNDSPAQVASAILGASSTGKLSGVGTGSPNLLVNTQFLNGDGGGGGDDGGGDSIPQLSNGVAVANISGAKNSIALYKFEVPPQTSKLTVDISGGTGDADLYVRSGSEPTASLYDCRPYKSGNTESCSLPSPVAGTVYIMLKGYSAYSGLNLKATAVTGQPNNAPCTDCERFTGELKNKGEAVQHPAATFRSAAGLQQIWLQGPDNADFDLFLYKKQGTAFVRVASSEKLKSSEQISYQGAEGDYQIRVVSYSGSGKYELYRKVP